MFTTSIKMWWYSVWEQKAALLKQLFLFKFFLFNFFCYISNMINNRQSWEMYKRRRIMSYPKRRNRRNIIIIIIAIILLAAIMGRCPRNSGLQELEKDQIQITRV